MSTRSELKCGYKNNPTSRFVCRPCTVSHATICKHTYVDDVALLEQSPI